MNALLAERDSDLTAPTPWHLLETAALVELDVGGSLLHGDLVVPAGAHGLVVFAHDSGSRHSPRHQRVARLLERARFGTLLFDPLTTEEERADADGHLRFDIGMLARRLLAVTGWVRQHESTATLPLGYLGTGTGAAAALQAAAAPGSSVGAVVSQGGRPDLAGAALRRVPAPTMLIVGSHDDIMLQLNREALDQLRCRKELAVVGGTTHRFKEPGALDQAAALAAQWFQRFLHN